MVEGLSLPRFTIEPLEARITPATFTVTTGADSGPGSLRQAILDANGLPGGDLITFADAFLQSGAAIAVISELPTITDSLSIDPGAIRKVHLDGTNAGMGANGLVVAGATSGTISGLEIFGFDGDGIVVGNATHYAFRENDIHGNHGNGIRVFGSTDVLMYRNTVVGNGETGILVEDSNSVKIGTVLAYPVPYFNTIKTNGLFGVEIRGGTGNSVGANTISGNGALAAAGEGGGIAVINAQNTNIGDFCLTDVRGVQRYIRGNTIEANNGVGVLIDHSSGTILTGNTITANAGDGVFLDAATAATFSMREKNSFYTTSYDKLVGNTISENGGWGINAVNGSSQLDVRGSLFKTNGHGGILLDGVNGAVIGGTTIYYNTYHNSGVETTEQTSMDGNIFDSGTQPGIVIKRGNGVSLTNNQFAGSGIPIDLGGDGATLNDPGDIDAGPNHLQNYPTLGSLDASGGEMSQTQALLHTDGVATAFRIQIYAYESQTSTFTVVGSKEVTTDANGRALLVFDGLDGPNLFATATNLTTGETSEMSPVAKTLPQLSIGNVTLSERDNGLTNSVLTVTLDKASDAPISVSFRTVNGTGVVDSDYSAVTGTLVFGPGETAKTITIPVIGDTVQEATESFYVDLSNAQGADIGSGRGEVKIVNDDGLSSISIEDALVVEGSNLSSTRPGYTEHQYRVILSGPSLDPVTVRLTSSGGTATAGDDYDAVDEVVTFAPGVTSVTKTVYVKNDTGAELNETIGFQLSEPSAGVIGTGAATLTIADEDGWMLVMDPVEVLEGSSSKMKETAVQVRLVNTLGLTDHLTPIHVSFLAQEGSARREIDFIAPEGVLTFAPGELEKTIMVKVVGDRVLEENESFGIQFGNAIGTKVPEAPGLVTILDDDIASLLISKGGKQATWLDADGDKVKLTVNKPVLTFESFVFGQTEGGGIVLQKLILPAEDGSQLSLKLKVAKTSSGDGQIDLETIDAIGRDLGFVMVDGNLGFIVAGDSILKTPGVRVLSVGSFGVHPGGVNVEPLESAVLGGVGSIKVKNDFTGVRLEVQGGNVGTLSVGGNVTDSLITVGGTSESATQVGKVKVRGDWTASSLAVGASAGPDGMFGTEDDLLAGGLLSKIARITIGGTLSGTPETDDATDHFGFVAGKIASFQVDKTRLKLSGSDNDVIELGATGDVTFRELA